MRMQSIISLSLCLLTIVSIRCAFSQNTTSPSLVVPIKKCVCNASEVQTAEGCKQHSPINIHIWNKATSTVHMLDLSQPVGHDTNVEPLTCPERNTKDVFMEGAFISTDGKLLKHPFDDTDLYCIENVVIEGGHILQRIEMCVESFTVKLCCEVDEYIDKDRRCQKIRGLDLQNFASEWMKNFQYVTENVNCEEEQKNHVALDSVQSAQDLRHNIMLLKEKSEDNFCLGLFGDGDDIHPGATFCASIPKLPYCCGQSEAFTMETHKCIPYEEEYQFAENIEWPNKGILHSYNSFINCSSRSFSSLLLNKEHQHTLMDNGSLHSETGSSLKFHEYCLGVVVVNGTGEHSGLVCLPERRSNPCPWRWAFYRVLIAISAVFLVATIAVYVGISDLRRRIGGLCLISELVALLISQVNLIVIQMGQSNFSQSGCLAAGVIEIVTVLASFFWLNVMCFDVWSTFRVFRPFSEKILKTKLFLKYSLYGWGVPLLVGILAVILEHADSPLKPNFIPTKSCFFTGKEMSIQWFYIYGIILTLLLVNVGFFVHLAVTLLSNQMEQRKAFKGSESGTSANQPNPDIENLKLYGKLFVVMGLPWLLEVFTSFADDGVHCYIWFLDIFNLLRGVLIFLIFVCKKSTRDLIVASWCPTLKSTPESSSSSQQSRKTSTMSLTSWLPSIHGRKISKVSMNSAGNINLEALKEENAKADGAKGVIREEDEEIEQESHRP